MLEKKTTEFIEALSSAAPVPGGGGAAAAVGAFAAALGIFVTNLTVGKKKYFHVEVEIKEIRSKLELLRDELVQLTDEDAKGFEPLAHAYKLPAETQEQKAEKEVIMEKALYVASIVPMKIMNTILEAMKLLRILGEKGSKIAVSDVGVGILFAQAALEGAALNVFTNTRMMKRHDVADKLNVQAEELIREGQALKEETYADVLAKIK